MIAQTARMARSRHGSPDPCCSTDAQPAGQRRDRQQFEHAAHACGEFRQREHDPAEAKQHQVDEVGGGEGRLGPQRPCHQQAEAAERRGAHEHKHRHAPRRRPIRHAAASRARTPPRRSPRVAVSRWRAWSTCGRRRARRVTAASRPSRFSTPYLRSKPVAIAWLANAVDMTASAMIPGVRKSTRLPCPRLSTDASLKPVSSRTGMINVSSNCSPLRSRPRPSNTACADDHAAQRRGPWRRRKIIIRNGCRAARRLGAAGGPGARPPGWQSP